MLRLGAHAGKGTSFLQIFLWERFSSITPRTIEFNEVIFRDVIAFDVLKKKKSHPYMPRARRWVGVKQATNKTLDIVINAKEEFTFRPYIHTPSVRPCSMPIEPRD